MKESKAKNRIVAGLIAIALVTLGATAIGPTGPRGRVGLTGPAATASTPLIIILMENKSYSNIVANAASVPYEMSLITQGLRFTKYSEAPSPSLPNYLLLASGSTCGKLGTDQTAAGQITSACPTTVWNQLQDAGFTWGVYMDDMNVPCSPKTTNTVLSADGGQGDQYALKHNPATPFAAVYGGGSASCKANVLPFTSFDPASLRNVSFISPGICDDQHGSSNTAYKNCLPKSAALYKRGDNWLKANVPGMLAVGANVIVTYDGPSSAMYTVEVGSGITPGTLDATPYTHCSLLAGIETSRGLGKLGCAQTVTPLPIG